MSLDGWGLKSPGGVSTCMSDSDTGYLLEHLHRASPCNFSDGASLGFLTEWWLNSNRSIPGEQMETIPSFIMFCEEHNGASVVVTKPTQNQEENHKP